MFPISVNYFFESLSFYISFLIINTKSENTYLNKNSFLIQITILIAQIRHISIHSAMFQCMLFLLNDGLIFKVHGYKNNRILSSGEKKYEKTWNL